jgi:hypothetical protein
MREFLRGCDLRRFDSSRYVHLHINLDVSLSIFNGSALVDASCEVAPFNALPLDQKDADTKAAVAAIDEAVRAINAHRSSLLVCAPGCPRLQPFANAAIACSRVGSREESGRRVIIRRPENILQARPSSQQTTALPMEAT